MPHLCVTPSIASTPTHTASAAVPGAAPSTRLSLWRWVGVGLVAVVAVMGVQVGQTQAQSAAGSGGEAARYTAGLTAEAVPVLDPRVFRRADAQSDPFLGPVVTLQYQLEEVQRALEIAPLYGVTTARVPLPSTDERLLINRDVIWFDVCSRLLSRPDAIAPESFTDARSDAPLRFGPYVGGWRSLGTTLVRGGEVQADVGLRLGMSW